MQLTPTRANVTLYTKGKLIKCVLIQQSQVPVSLQLRISPQHHEIVRHKQNILKIMEQTNTKVC